MDASADAIAQCDLIGERLKSEVNRIAYARRREWAASVKVVASSMKEAVSERVAIWESVEDSFLTAFPQYNNKGEA